MYKKGPITIAFALFAVAWSLSKSIWCPRYTTEVAMKSYLFYFILVPMKLKMKFSQVLQMIFIICSGHQNGINIKYNSRNTLKNGIYGWKITGTEAIPKACLD